jgi:hypothetical protein
MSFRNGGAWARRQAQSNTVRESARLLAFWLYRLVFAALILAALILGYETISRSLQTSQPIDTPHTTTDEPAERMGRCSGTML